MLLLEAPQLYSRSRATATRGRGVNSSHTTFSCRGPGYRNPSRHRLAQALAPVLPMLGMPSCRCIGGRELGAASSTSFLIPPNRPKTGAASISPPRKTICQFARRIYFGALDDFDGPHTLGLCGAQFDSRWQQPRLQSIKVSNQPCASIASMHQLGQAPPNYALQEIHEAVVQQTADAAVVTVIVMRLALCMGWRLFMWVCCVRRLHV